MGYFFAKRKRFQIEQEAENKRKTSTNHGAIIIIYQNT
jgi:hypothetical protein